MALTQRQQRTLELICETLLPALKPGESDDPILFSNCASDHKLHEHFLRRLGNADEQDRVAVVRLLTWIETPGVCRLVTGRIRPFSKLNLDERADVLRSWSIHSSAKLRRLFQSIKRLTMFLGYSTVDETNTNPAWQAFGYSGKNPLSAKTGADELQPFSIGSSKELSCDVLIVGLVRRFGGRR